MARQPWVLAAAFWTALCIAAVPLRGVRWDECFEFAQVLAGSIPYPDEHALSQHVRRLFTVQHWMLAWWLRADPPWLPAAEASLNAFRNALFLLASVMPVFTLARAQGVRAAWASAAALLALAGVHAAFYSNYPVQIWPDLYSNGQIGQGWALFVLAAAAARRHALAGLLLGLMPMVHAGQSPPVYLLAACACLVLLYRGEWRCIARGASGFLPGIGAASLFFLYHRLQLPLPPPGYDGIAVREVLQGYLASHDGHRAPPFGTGHLLLAGALLLGFLQRGRAPGAGLLAGYAVIVAAIVWGTMALHLLLGANTPALLLGWMPYRLVNHAGPLLIALIAGTLARDSHTARSAALLFAALALLALRPAAVLALPESLYERYLADGSAAMFLLFGGALAVAIAEKHGGNPRGRISPGAIALAALPCLALAAWHRFGAACMIAGILLAWMPFLRAYASRSARWTAPSYAAAAAAVLALAGVLFTEWQARSHLPRTPFETAVRAHLAREKAPGLVLAPYQQEGLQARLGAPMMADMATLTWIPYHPGLGPPLYRMYLDLYGLNIAPRPGSPARKEPWFEYWPGLDAGAWRELSLHYGFRHVYAPAFMDLALEPLLDSSDHRLWRIPE